jgi:hypothetical protein
MNMAYPTLNSLKLALDIAGSLTQASNLTLSEEPLGLGAVRSGQTGSGASVSTVSAGIATISGITGMTAQSVGGFLTLSGATSSSNNGTFLIVNYNSATSVDVANASAISADAANGTIAWAERNPYSAEDDFNYARTDREAIKGVSYYAAVPTYQRPTAIGTTVPANLSNIAGKTTDAIGFVLNKQFLGATAVAGDTKLTITSAGNLLHSSSTDKTGVPCFDTTPYLNDRKACLVNITDPATDNELTSSDGYKIIGFTNAGSSTSPNSVEVLFYKVAHGADISTAVPYTWGGTEPTSLDLTYGYFTRLDQADEYSFRSIQVLGVQSDADLRRDINDLQLIVGSGDDTTSLAGLLTNTTANYAFNNLPDATPSVVEALNTLNSQVGDRTYTGTYLTSGQTVASSLQSLANAFTNTHITRTIERLSSSVTSNTAHTLPAGLTYSLDGSGNGNNMFVFWRGLLRDPGSVATGNDYSETSTTTITPYSKINSGEHINYFIKG